ncbi:MAG: hypothetical protein AAFY10_01340 [Pseudomonadota bacterium]
MRSLRMWVWLVPFALYGLFWLWYTPLAGPMTQAEIDDAVASLEQRGAEPETIERLRTFFEADDGRSFIMVNILDQVDDPIEMPATGPGASAGELMGHYMEYMWPALFSRACHPVFAGQSVGATMDVVGIEGAERWESAAMMRYRSRRDMWEISSDPRFGDRHDYKVAALEKTIAFPVVPQLFLGDPRLILFLVLIAVLSLVDNFVQRRRRGSGGASAENQHLNTAT